jgi:hypothetical protein
MKFSFLNFVRPRGTKTRFENRSRHKLKRCDDIYYQWDLNRYDLDKDGLFGGQEITDEQKAAMQRLTNDVGRNFSFITGFIFAGAIGTMIYLLGRLKGLITKRGQ